jgi:hypothetical protein
VCGWEREREREMRVFLNGMPHGAKCFVRAVCVCVLTECKCRNIDVHMHVYTYRHTN